MPTPHAIDCRRAQALPIDDPAVRGHLEECVQCRDAARPLRAAWEVLGIVTEREPSPRFTARVMTAIAEHDRTRFRPFRWLGARRAWWVASAAAAMTAVLVVGFLRDPTGTPGDGADVVSEMELIQSEELLQHLEVVQDLDLLLLMDES